MRLFFIKEISDLSVIKDMLPIPEETSQSLATKIKEKKSFFAWLTEKAIALEFVGLEAFTKPGQSGRTGTSDV